MPTTATNTPHVIVCDDNDDILAFAYALLRRGGFQVTTVHGWSELERVLRSGVQPNLFVLDVLMPEYDGFWIADELQFQGYKVPIIFMTAFDDPILRLNAPVRCAAEYLVKPLDPDVLLEKISHTVRLPPPSESNWNLKVTESRSRHT